MAFKAVNDIAGPNGLVPTLLVFGAYPRIGYDSPPSQLASRRAEAAIKAMTELRGIIAKRKINDVLSTRNGPNIAKIIQLELGTEVRVYREKKGWQGPYKVLSIALGKVIIDLTNGPTDFATTYVQPYLRAPDASPSLEAPLVIDTIIVAEPPLLSPTAQRTTTTEEEEELFKYPEL